MSRQQIATAAVRAIAIWMIVQGVAAGAGSLIFLARTRSLGVPDQPSGQLLFTVVVILLVGGMILWATGQDLPCCYRDHRLPDASHFINASDCRLSAVVIVKTWCSTKSANSTPLNEEPRVPRRTAFPTRTAYNKKEAAEAASFAKRFGSPAVARNLEMVRLRALRYGGQPSHDIRAKVGGRQELELPTSALRNAE